MAALFAVIVTVGAFGIIALTRAPVDLTFGGALTLLLVFGIVPVHEALIGFGSEGLITVAAMYIVAAGLRDTGVVSWIARQLLGRPRTVRAAQMRLMGPSAVVSAFLNNTPLVAIMIPAVREWARNLGMSTSKLMIPLSYAAVLGGTITLIGTSTNLVVAGLLRQRTDVSLGLFDIAVIGLPTAIIGITFVVLVSNRLLPERMPLSEVLADPREYSVTMTVTEAGPLVGKSVESAGLRNLASLDLIELERTGEVRAAVAPDDVLEGGDRLVFVGLVDSVLQLQRLPGLTPADGQVFKLDGHRPDRILIEAVVSNTGPLIGRSIRSGRFRDYYGAAVVAVARNGVRLKQKVGDIVLLPGDTLLLEASPGFVEAHRNSRDFHLVSPVPDSSPPHLERRAFATVTLAGLVVLVTTGMLPIVTAALLAAGAMLLTRCVSAESARRSVDWTVLIVIGAALGMGRALEITGAADILAGALSSISGGNPHLLVLGLYLVTVLLTEVITNNAAAALMFPVAMGMADAMGLSIVPLAVTIMMAASASFATPVGYQTNLMVMGPGGYHFRDYLVLGLPLTLITCLLSTLLIPLIWVM